MEQEQQEQEVSAPVGERSHVWLVFLTAMCCLIDELILSRVAGFHLGESYAYMAIPVTFLGLALGSVHVHLSRRVVERFNVSRHTLLLLVVTIVAIGVMFSLFQYVFPVYSEFRVTRSKLDPLWETLTFIALNIVPFYVIGRILAVTYFINRERIGAIYSADLWGASIACCLTPLLFHFFDLPDVVLALVLGLSVLVLRFQKGHGVRRRLIAGLALVALCVGCRFFVAWSEDNLDFSRFELNQRERATQVAHRWNEFSRVVLMRFERGQHVRYNVLHDNGRSNVHVERYRPDRVRENEPLSTFNAPWIMGREIDDILVMFAGCGAEMIQFNEQTAGRASITGVEINPLVRDLVLEAPEMRSYQLQAFYDRPNIDLVIQEGRHFLANGDNQYDLIFQGSDAATGFRLTAHSRKYLDTVEAYSLYLKRLRPRGVLAVHYKPIEERLLALRAAFIASGGTDFASRVIVLDNPDRNNDDMLFSPAGFSPEEVQRLRSKVTGRHVYRIRYAPGYRRNQRHFVDLITSPPGDGSELMTDDSPFLIGLDLEHFAWNPIGSRQLFIGWVKVMTFIVITAFALLLIISVQLPRTNRLPPSVLLFLLATGFCYMLCEIALMAKLELFLQIPIVTMATVLSVFLIAGGVGSRLTERFAARLDMRLVPFVVAALVYLTLLALDQLNAHLIWLPTVVKVVIAAAAVFPVGVCLGLFYPYAVTCLVGNDRGRVVPITYGVSTLSSVVGATYAITFMVETGFSALLEQAVMGYLGLGVFVVLYYYILKGRMLTARS